MQAEVFKTENDEIVLPVRINVGEIVGDCCLQGLTLTIIESYRPLSSE